MAWTLRLSRPTPWAAREAPLPALRRQPWAAAMARHRMAGLRLLVLAGAACWALLWVACVWLLIREMVGWYVEFGLGPLQQGLGGFAPPW